ncbi:MAG TPA: glycoside hydrolase family 13 protein [Firmicutes bacterium]|nr:glycoside hydrolase family 13 protein [Bacillota bacterium]
MPGFVFEPSERSFVNRLAPGRWLIRFRTVSETEAAVTGVSLVVRPGEPAEQPEQVEVGGPPPLLRYPLVLIDTDAGNGSVTAFWEAIVELKEWAASYQFVAEAGTRLWAIGPEGQALLATATSPPCLPEVGWYSLRETCQPLYPVVPWTQEAVVYQIFPDRFANADTKNDPPGTTPWNGPIRPDTSRQYFGGDLAGIRQRLPYLNELGVTALYLNPIFAASSSHRYDTVDYRRIDPSLGTLDDFRALLDDAHRMGIRIILDGVFNHVGTGFWAFQDVCRRGAASPYVDWFYIHSFPVRPDLGNYECWWGIPSLPKLNVSHRPVREHLLEVVRYWTAFGIDGWRLDVPNEIQVLGFWEEFRQVVKSINPQAYIVGEIWRPDPSWLQGDRFDGLMNYPWGLDALVPFFRNERGWTPSRLRSVIRHLLWAYPPQALAMMFNVVDSHDTDRVLSLLGGGNLGEKPRPEAVARLKALAAVQFTLPGVPVIYYGDERGMLGEKRDNWDAQRAPVNWQERNEELFQWYKRLIQIRRTHPALRGSRLTFVLADDHTGVLAFRRPDPRDLENPASGLFTATTARDEPTRSFLPLPEVPGGYLDLLSGKRFYSEPRGVQMTWNGPATVILQATQP